MKARTMKEAEIDVMVLGIKEKLKCRVTKEKKLFAAAPNLMR